MQLHDRLGFVVMVVSIVGAVAGVFALLRPQWMPAIRVYLRLTLAVVAVQVVVGIVLVTTGSRPSQGIHWFYGAATLVSLPIGFAIGSRLGAREEPLWVVGGAVATVLFALRAMTTG
jgi:heme A synthase